MRIMKALGLCSFSELQNVVKAALPVQEAENGRALSEGTVLCSQDRIPIGRIEDTFGPVMCPLYTLRWASQGNMPPSLTVGAPIFTTQKLAEYLLPEQLYTNVSYAPDAALLQVLLNPAEFQVLVEL